MTAYCSRNNRMHRVQQSSLQYYLRLEVREYQRAIHIGQLRNGRTGNGTISGRALVFNLLQSRSCVRRDRDTAERIIFRLTCYTCRWIVFSVRMVIEPFSPSLFPISVTHYPLKNRQALAAAGDQVSDPFPSYWAILRDQLLRLFSFEPRVIAVLCYKYRKLPPGYTVSL